MTDVLKGVRVVELQHHDHRATRRHLLADLGAEVIKVEHPEGGDPFRSFRGGHYSPHFTAYNRGKRSIKLDLRKDEGRAVLLKLIGTHGYPAGELPRRRDGTGSGLPPARAQRDLNPKLIHCSITGFGATGPYSEQPVYDSVELGAFRDCQPVSRSREPAGRTDRRSRTTSPACMLAIGVLGALYEREQTGQGRRIEINMLKSGDRFHSRPVRQPHAVGHPQRSPHPCRDLALVRVPLRRRQAARGASVVTDEVLEKRLLIALNRPDLQRRARFKTRDVRMRNFSELTRVLGGNRRGRNRVPQWMSAVGEKRRAVRAGTRHPGRDRRPAGETPISKPSAHSGTRPKARSPRSAGRYGSTAGRDELGPSLLRR